MLHRTLLPALALTAFAACSSGGGMDDPKPDAVALTEGGRLQPVDTMGQRTAGPAKAITGAEGMVLGIDVRPANGMLYAVTDASIIYALDPMSGAATGAVKLSQPFTGKGAVTVDFNPVADRIRLMAEDGTNFRIHPDTGAVTVDGTLKYDPADAQAGKPATIVAGAYTNSVAGTKETDLYTVDAAKAQLNMQAPPNDGVQKTKGPLGSLASRQPAFDIVSMAVGTNRAVLIDGTSIMGVDVMTGAVTPMGMIKGLNTAVTDIALMAPMTTTAAK